RQALDPLWPSLGLHTYQPNYRTTSHIPTPFVAVFSQVSRPDQPHFASGDTGPVPGEAQRAVSFPARVVCSRGPAPCLPTWTTGPTGSPTGYAGFLSPHRPLAVAPDLRLNGRTPARVGARASPRVAALASVAGLAA